MSELHFTGSEHVELKELRQGLRILESLAKMFQVRRL